jgi:hypothetical protein
MAAFCPLGQSEARADIVLQIVASWLGLAAAMQFALLLPQGGAGCAGVQANMLGTRAASGSGSKNGGATPGCLPGLQA